DGAYGRFRNARRLNQDRLARDTARFTRTHRQRAFQADATARGPRLHGSLGTSRGVVMLTLEVVSLPVTNIDRAIAFYINQAGFILDVDYHPTVEFRVVQLTPPGSACSVQLVTANSLSRVHNLYLVTNDLATERAKLIAHGVAVGAVRHKDPI